MLESGRIGAFSPYEAAFLAAGICLFMLFFVVERYQKQPMLPLFLLKDRRFLLVTLQTLVLFAGFQSAMYFLSFLYIQSYEYTALQAGAATLPISIIVALIALDGRGGGEIWPAADIVCIVCADGGLFVLA